VNGAFDQLVSPTSVEHDESTNSVVVVFQVEGEEIGFSLCPATAAELAFSILATVTPKEEV